MSLVEKLEKSFKEALKNREELKVSTFRMAKAALKNKQKDLMRDLVEEEVTAILRTLIKQRYEAKELFQKGGREDLSQKEAEEIAILSALLPPLLSQEELHHLLEKTIADLNPTGPRDMGRVMKEMMGTVAGRANGKQVSELVKAKLAAL